MRRGPRGGHSKGVRGGRKRGGERGEGRVDHVASGGDGVLLGPRGPLYVAGALPGDHIRFERAGSFGTLLEVVSPGSERRKAACEAVGVCGGCPWMSWDYPRQAAHKRAMVERCVGEVVGGALRFEGSDDLGYRRRATLSFDGTRLGFLADRSDRVVDRTACVVLAPTLQPALTKLRGLRLEGRGEIALARSHERAVATIRAAQRQPPSVYERCHALVGDGFAGIALSVEGLAPAVFGDPTERTLGADGVELVGTVGGFSQAHDTGNDVLVRTVAALADPSGRRVLELHAGHGNLGVLLARGAARYLAVELDAGAVAALRENLTRRGLAGRALAADAAHYPAGDHDVVVLDPPRRGAPEVVARLVKDQPARIVYVACSPTALQRDLAPLRAGGYVVDEAAALDLFPQTPHVETVVRLVRSA